ncbi:hypothetical protein O3X23_43620, partial [Streptomyces sp. H39-S7]|nr:hypothetical protein [Streptomyces sp. H39-S7]
IDRNKNDKYDFDGAGPSELDPKLPQEATAPTDCGMVMGASVGSIPVGGIETGGGSPQSAAMPAAVAGGAVSVSLAMVGAIVVVRRRRALAAVLTESTGSAA